MLKIFIAFKYLLLDLYRELNLNYVMTELFITLDIEINEYIGNGGFN